MAVKKFLAVFALVCACAAPAFAAPAGPKAASDVPPNALTPFDGWNGEGALRLGPRASFVMGGGDYEARGGGDPAMRAFMAGVNYELAGGVSLYGSYIRQDLPEWNLPDSGDGAPRAWAVQLGLSQERLGFTSMTLEYGRIGAGFYLPGNGGLYEENFSRPLSNGRRDFNFSEDADVWFMGARQRWGSRFSTFQGYGLYDERNFGEVRQWTVGMGWQYSPGVYMELAYDDQSGALDARDYSDKRVRMRTMISF